MAGTHAYGQGVRSFSIVAMVNHYGLMGICHSQHGGHCRKDGGLPAIQDCLGCFLKFIGSL